MYTVCYFMAEGIPRRTIYSIIKRSTYLPAKRKCGSGFNAEKMKKKQVNQLKKVFDHKDGLSTRQAAAKFDIDQSYVVKL